MHIEMAYTHRYPGVGVEPPVPVVGRLTGVDAVAGGVPPLGVPGARCRAIRTDCVPLVPDDRGARGGAVVQVLLGVGGDGGRNVGDV